MLAKDATEYRDVAADAGFRRNGTDSPGDFGGPALSTDRRVRDCRDVRVDAPQVADHMKKQAASLGNQAHPISFAPAGARCRVAQQSNMKSGCLRLHVAKSCFARNEPRSLFGIAAQEDADRKAQAIEDFAVDCCDRVDLLSREEMTALDLLDGNLHQAARDDVTGMLEVQDRRENLLRAGTLQLIVQGLLVSQIGKVSTNRCAQAIKGMAHLVDLRRALSVTVAQRLEG